MRDQETRHTSQTLFQLNKITVSKASKLVYFRLKFAPEELEERLEGEEDGDADREEEGDVDGVLLVVGEVEQRQQGLVEEGSLGEL